MTMKIFKTTLTCFALVILCTLTGCLHNPEVPFIQPNQLSKDEAKSIEKIASIIFSDLLFDSPLGDRSFSSVKFEFNAKDKRLLALTTVINRLIQKDNSIYYSAGSLQNHTFDIKFITKPNKQMQSIEVILIDNYTKKSVYTKIYQVKTYLER